MKIIRYTDPEPMEIMDFEKDSNFEITLKENSDYVCSVLGKSIKWNASMRGVFHLYDNKHEYSVSSNGETPDIAILNLCKEISLKGVNLKGSKKIIMIPHLVHSKIVNINQ